MTCPICHAQQRFYRYCLGPAHSHHVRVISAHEPSVVVKQEIKNTFKKTFNADTTFAQLNFFRKNNLMIDLTIVVEVSDIN